MGTGYNRDMDPTLKNRLIGAAVLIVIAAIVLPILLSGKPPQGQETSQVRPVEIPPAPNPDMSREVLPLGRDVAETDRVAAVDFIEGQMVAPATPEPATAAPPPASTEPATPSTSQPAVSPAPVATAPATQPSAPAPARDTVATTAGGRFWVNLGGYGQAANVARVASAAEARGYPVEREAGANNITRVKAGPFATRAQAEQARQHLLAAVPDAKPTVTESGSAPTTAAPADVRAGAWAVQVGAFGERGNAQQLSDRLRGAGYPAFVAQRGQSWAVRVGPYVRRTEAEAQRQRLQTGQKLGDAIVVSHSD